MFLMLFFSSAVYAETYHLQFRDHIFGGHRTLNLEQALQNQHRIDAKELEISRIEVVVKSQQGGGQVWLGSRYSQTNRQTAPGSAVNFDNPADWTYATLPFLTQGMGGDLMLNLNGQLKLREVVVHARKLADDKSVVKSRQGDARVTLPMNHQHLTGLYTLNLKKVLRNQSKINPDRYDLKGIEVAVKSRQGGGQVWLESGNQATEIQTIKGVSANFERRDPHTYYRIFLKALQQDNQKTPWLLQFNGEIMLNEIIINLVPK
jgi:hypothetical protein